MNTNKTIVSICVYLCLFGTPLIFAQSPAFEVASVKPSVPGTWAPPNFPLDSRNAKTPGGRLRADFPLSAYTSFAYKLSSPESRAALDHLPAWIGTDRFTIDARADGNPTKDQMRLMMQSLLADRFKLAVHFETREIPVFDLILVKPGKNGPKLIPHSAGPPCPDSYRGQTIGGVSDVFPLNCETAAITTRNYGVTLLGSRNSTMQHLADAISGNEDVNRPVVDKTGLDGRFDFTIEYMPSENALAPDSHGAPFLTALREQLGLKLVSSKGPIRTLVMDHVERPSAN
jgi:uncharacterized protein (TIGR03435 family)